LRDCGAHWTPTPKHAAPATNDEPFVLLHGGSAAASRLRQEINHAGFHVTRGSRFFHILGKNDKGSAARKLLSCYRRVSRTRIRSVGLGDSPNDIPLLRAVDVPILVARPGGRYDREVRGAVPRVARAGGVGPSAGIARFASVGLSRRPQTPTLNVLDWPTFSGIIPAPGPIGDGTCWRLEALAMKHMKHTRRIVLSLALVLFATSIADPVLDRVTNSYRSSERIAMAAPAASLPAKVERQRTRLECSSADQRLVTLTSLPTSAAEPSRCNLAIRIISS
jgi:hypothetical protein